MVSADYISREAIEQIIASECGECADTCLEFDGIQPDCNQCLLYGVVKAVKALPAADVRPRWIPVTEEPPLKVGDDGYSGYLVYANGYYEVADYTTDKFDNVPCFHVDGEYEPGVTHWMPLPEPPKEE